MSVTSAFASPRAPLNTRAARLRGLILALPVAWTVVLVGTTPAFATASRAPSPIGSAPVSDAAAAYLEGIDVSHWQNSIDWSRVAGAGR